MTQPSNRSITEIADEIRRRIALIGSFDPVAEVPIDLTREARDDVLALLAPDCREQIVGGRVLWFLQPAARLREMERLRGSGEDRNAAVQAVAPSIFKDDFGKSLQSALLGAEIDGISPAELDLAQKSHGFASVVLPEARLKAQLARARISRVEADDSLAVVAPARLFGRDQSLSALLEFASSGLAPKRFWPFRGRVGADGAKMRRRPARSDWVQVFSVSGVGGSGKSALVGKLVQQVRSDWIGPPVVILDFDRPRLSRADPIELLFDTTRQLGLARPELQDGLTAFRRKQRAMLENFAAATAETYDVRARVVSTAFSELGDFLRSWSVSHETILVVLDTFEEVLVRPPYVAQVVFRWLDGLRDEVGLTSLRVVVSGRVQPHEKVPSLASRLAGEMVLDDLEFDDAVNFLRSSNVPNDLAIALAETFGGNPLVLKILSQFCASRSNDEIWALTNEQSSERGKFQGEFAQQFLYTRILNRIADPVISKLAHPGLVLRRVTPDLIRSVLAGPCKLGPIGAAEARALFERLAEQVWLVRREGDGSVWHRRDLRRLMLPQVVHETPPEILEEIHANAAAFYRNAAQEAERGSRWEIEARYHELQLNADVEINTSEAALLLNALGPDIENLSERSRARLKVAAGAETDVTASEAVFLSSPDQERVSVALDSERRKHGASLFRVESRLATPGARPIREAENPWEAADPNSLIAEKLCSSFDAGSFSAVARSAQAHLQGLLIFARGEISSRAPTDPVSTNWWRSALAGLTARTPILHRRSFVEQAFNHLARGKASSAGGEVVWPGSTTLEAFVAATACLVSAGRGDEAISIPSQGSCIRVFSTRRRTIETMADLRVVNVLLVAGLVSLEDLKGALVNAGLLAAFSTELSEGGGRIGLQRLSRDMGAESRDSYRDRLSNPRLSGPTLAKVDDVIAALTKDSYRIEVPSDPIKRDHLRTALRGLTPEIRGVLRVAHSRDPIPPSRWPRLVENLGEGGAWPIDLSGKALEKAMRRDESRWFATLLSHVDRFGRLGDLLTDMCRESPGARRLSAATELLQRYDNALRGTLPVPTVKGRYAQ